jgi:hypothetical protein
LIRVHFSKNTFRPRKEEREDRKRERGDRRWEMDKTVKLEDVDDDLIV